MNVERGARRRRAKGRRAQHGRRIVTLTAAVRRPGKEEIAAGAPGGCAGQPEQGGQPEQAAGDR